MSKKNRQATVRQSILDRLIQTRETEPKSWDESVVAVRDSVIRDLTWLLNTRETGDPASDPYRELERSIYNYGLQDFASMNADEATTPMRLLHQIERKIELFEPRLVNVRVRPAENEGRSSAPLRFVVHATLRLDPDPGRVEFDTVVEMSSGHFQATT